MIVWTRSYLLKKVTETDTNGKIGFDKLAQKQTSLPGDTLFF